MLKLTMVAGHKRLQALCLNLVHLAAGGRVQVDKGLNGRLYGSAVLPEHILHGDVAPPKEMFPLFEALNRLAADS